MVYPLRTITFVVLALIVVGTGMYFISRDEASDTAVNLPEENLLAEVAIEPIAAGEENDSSPAPQKTQTKKTAPRPTPPSTHSTNSGQASSGQASPSRAAIPLPAPPVIAPASPLPQTAPPSSNPPAPQNPPPSPAVASGGGGTAPNPPIPPPAPPPVIPPPPPPPPPAPEPPPALPPVISEIQISGGPGATTNDFVELYNPGSAPFNLKGFRLVKRTAQGTSDTLLKSWTNDAFIPAHGFYLWVNSDYTGIGLTPDVTTSGSIADNNGIALREGPNDTGTIVDSVAWGDTTNGFGEGMRLAGGLAPNQSYERRALTGNTCVSPVGPGENLGNACDSNNNALDFELRTTPHPQNSSSAPEP